MIYDGQPKPVTATYVGVAGEHHVVLSSRLDEIRDTFIANSARKLAYELFLVEAMQDAIFAADPDSSLRGMSFDAETLAVDLDGDDDGSMEDRKEFVRAFVGGVSVVPGEARLDVQMRTLPAVGVLRHSNSACGLVAGARFVPLQMKLQPLNRYLAGLQTAA